MSIICKQTFINELGIQLDRVDSLSPVSVFPTLKGHCIELCCGVNRLGDSGVKVV